MFIQRAESPVRLNGIEAARRFFSGCLDEVDQKIEHLWVAHVDQQVRCVHLARVEGSAGHAALSLKPLVEDATRLGSAGLILAHNHPSGDATPSEADRALTRRVALVSEALDVALLDHLVIAGDECRSMREMGWI